jgi:hypothetical protein
LALAAGGMGCMMRQNHDITGIGCGSVFPFWSSPAQIVLALSFSSFLCASDDKENEFKTNVVNIVSLYPWSSFSSASSTITAGQHN